MAFCPNCGEPLGDTPGRGEVEDAAVKIARMECERDIEIERIRAGVHRQQMDTEETIAELEAEVAPAVAAAETAAAVAVLEAGAPQQEGGEAPVVVEEAPAQQEVVVDDAPPPKAVETEGSQPPEPPAKRGIGMWSTT